MSEAVPEPQALEAEGQRLFSQQQYETAAERFTLAYEAYAQTGEGLKAAEMLNNAGVVFRSAHRHKKAADALEQAQQMFAQLEDQAREAQVLGNLGGLYSKMKRYDEAEVSFQRAVDLFQELDDMVRQSETLRAMAIMQFKRGQRRRAFATYEDALYFLPNPNFLQRFTRFLLKVQGAILRFSPLR
jgi:tetratricopeptide (TPR) repeat protein